MQALSCTSAVVLVAICGLLLRSQALVSGARSPNFEPSDPDIESSSVSSELMPIIVLLSVLLAVPAIMAITLTIYSKKKFNKLAEDTKPKALEPKAQASAFLGEEDDSFSNEHRRRSQSDASPREVAIRLSPDTLFLEGRTVQSFTSSAAGVTSSAPPARATLTLPLPDSGIQLDSSSHGECSDFDTDFHLSDTRIVHSLAFATDATSSAHNLPLNTILLTSSKTGNQNFFPMQRDHLSSEEDFHFCDFEALGNSNAAKKNGIG